MQTIYIGNTLVNDIFLGNQRMDDVFEIFQGSNPIVQNFVKATGISDVTIINSLDTLVTSMQSNNLWDKMYAVYPLVGGTADTTKYNLVNTGSYTLQYTGSINYTTNGISGSGNTTNKGWANTQFYLISSSLTSNYTSSNSFGVYVRNDLNTGYDMGVETAGSGNDMYLISKYIDNKTYYYNGTGGLNASISDSSGFTVGTISGSSGVNQWIYKNGVNIVSSSNSVGMFLSNEPLYFMANNGNFGGTGINEPTSRQFAFMFMGKGLNSTDASNLYTIVQTFQTSLGRQV